MFRLLPPPTYAVNDPLAVFALTGINHFFQRFRIASGIPVIHRINKVLCCLLGPLIGLVLYARVILEIRCLQNSILGRQIRRARGRFPTAIARTATVRAASIATGRRSRWLRSKRRTASRLTPTAADQPRRHQRDNAENTTSPRSPAQHALPRSGPLPPHCPERGPCHIANQNTTARATAVSKMWKLFTGEESLASRHALDLASLAQTRRVNDSWKATRH